MGHCVSASGVWMRHCVFYAYASRCTHGHSDRTCNTKTQTCAHTHTGYVLKAALRKDFVTKYQCNKVTQRLEAIFLNSAASDRQRQLQQYKILPQLNNFYAKNTELKMVLDVTPTDKIWISQLTP